MPLAEVPREDLGLDHLDQETPVNSPLADPQDLKGQRSTQQASVQNPQDLANFPNGLLQADRLQAAAENHPALLPVVVAVVTGPSPKDLAKASC